MNLPRLLATIAMIACSAACLAGPMPDFAIAETTSNGQLLLITAARLDPKSVVQLQFPGEPSGTPCCQRLKASLFKPSRRETVTGNELADAEPFVYETRIPSQWEQGTFIGIAVVGDFRVTRSQPDLLEGRTRNGTALKATLCTSSEGVHLQATQRNRLQTHLYLGIGYDIADPTCRFPQSKR